MSHNPRGLCVVFNNETFPGTDLKTRAGTKEDESRRKNVNQSARAFRVITFLCDAETLRVVFTKLGFTVVVHNDLTAEDIRSELQRLAKRNFVNEDALVRDLTASLYNLALM